MIVWAGVSAAIAGDVQAPYSVMYEEGCRCLRFEYGSGHVPARVDVPFGDVVGVASVPAEGDLHDIVLRTRSGPDRLVYRAPCPIAMDYGLRFANNLGLALTGEGAAVCSDRMQESLERWVESVPDVQKVHTLEVALADVDARDRRDRSREDLLSGLSNQRGMLAYCFTEAHAVGQGRFRLVLDDEGHPRSVRAVETAGSSAVDTCVVETLLAAQQPLGADHGKAWVTVGFNP